MANPYAKQTWTDGSGGGTPVSAARLGVMEQGILDAHYQPAVRVTHNASQSIASSATLTALAFNTERFDQASNAADTMHDTVTNNSRLTCRYAGVYVIWGNVQWASTPSSASGADHVIRKNGTTTLGRSLPVSVNSLIWQVFTIDLLAVNDYVELCVAQQTGAAINITVNANYSPEFAMSKVA